MGHEKEGGRGRENVLASRQHQISACTSREDAIRSWPALTGLAIWSHRRAGMLVMPTGLADPEEFQGTDKGQSRLEKGGGHPCRKSERRFLSLLLLGNRKRVAVQHKDVGQ